MVNLALKKKGSKRPRKKTARRSKPREGRSVFSLWLSDKEKSFLARFLACYAILFALIKILPLAPVNLLVAWLQAKILSAAGFEVFMSGANLLVGSAAFEIIIDCSGFVMMILFFSLLYATRTRIPPARLLAYFAFFFLFNLARLAFTLSIGASYGDGPMNLVHPALWFVDSGVVFAAWAKEYGLW